MLVGRQTELETLRSTLRGGRSAGVLGEAGIGKTALLREAARSLRRPALEGRSLATLSYVSYLPLMQALGTPPAADAAGVALWASRRTNRGVLLLDDLHWADPETLDVLPLLVEHAPLLVAIRTADPRTAAAVEVATAAGIDLLPLEGLSAEQSDAVLCERRPALSESERARVVALARGNPLFLEELSAAGGASSTLAASLRNRLARCSRAARRAMAILALLGRDAEAELLPREVEELVAAGLAEKTARDAYRVRHPLLGEATRASLDDAERASLHAALARRLGDAGEAARHHQAAGELDAARERALEAAGLARRPGDRARHLAVAAECSLGGEWDGLRLDAAEALLEADDPRRADELAARVRSGDPERQARALLVRGRAAYAEGRLRAAGRHFRRGLELVDGRGSAVEVLLRIHRSELLQTNDANDRHAMRDTRIAWRIAERTGAHRPLARWALGCALWWVGDSPTSIGHLRAALDDARRDGDVALECRIVTNLHSALLCYGASEEGIELVSRTVDRAAAAGLRVWELQLHWMAVRATAYAHGEYDAARAQLVELLGDPGFGYPNRTMASADLAFMLAALGRHSEARAALAAQARGRYPYGDDILLESEWEGAWLAGDAERCRDAAARVLAKRRSKTRAVAAAAHAWALLDLGERPRSLAGRRFAVPRMTRWWLAEAEGLWRLGRGEHEQAEARLLAAARGYRGTYLHLELRALLGAALAAHAAGAARRARGRLSSVESRAAAVGLEPIAGRARRALRDCGLRRSARRSRAGEPLTAREQEVLRLVAEGLTSRAIAARLGIAPATVDTLVRSGTARLGVRTRRQAVAELARPHANGRLLAIADGPRAAAALVDRARAGGAEVRRGWALPPSPWILERHVVCVGAVADQADARAALLVAARGAEVIVEGPVATPLQDVFLDDLRRLGNVVVRTTTRADRITAEKRTLIELVAAGLSVREAAERLHVSRRTADRMLAEARRTLGASSNAEAVALYTAGATP